LNLLAIESSTEQCSVALRCGDQTQQLVSDQPRGHAEQILPMIETLLADSGISRQQIDQVVFGQGPGSFTGVRIACSVAQGLGFGLDIPVLPISSLAGLAQAALPEIMHTEKSDTPPTHRIIVAQDARLGEIYAGTYEFVADELTAITTEQVLKPASFDNHFRLSGDDWVAAGNGWQVYFEALHAVLTGRVKQQLPACHPDAKALLKLATGAVYRHRGVSADQAQPVYVRDQVTHR